MKDKHIKKFNELPTINTKINELKKSNDGYCIESITIGEFIDLLSEYNREDEICFSYNGDQGFIGLGKSNDNLLTKWSKNSKSWFLELVYY